MAKKFLAFLFLLLACIGCTKTPIRELRLYTWSEYFEDGIIKEFEAENHVHVKVDYVSSNEELLAKMQLSANSGDGYDLILPTDYMVQTMVDLNLIRPMDHAKLHFFADLDPKAVSAEYDPGLKYVVPMAIGTTGVLVNSKLTPDVKELSWKEIYENPKYTNKVILIDDAKEVLQTALFVLGKNIKTATENDVTNAFAYLQKHKKNIKAFVSEARPSVEADECAICQVYSGDALSFSKTKQGLHFILPSDGASIWSDNFAIPKNAKNEDLAYAFMNKVLSIEGAKRFTNNIHYRTANLKAAADTTNTVIYPSAIELARAHYMTERKDLALVIDKEWTKLKSN